MCRALRLTVLMSFFFLSSVCASSWPTQIMRFKLDETNMISGACYGLGSLLFLSSGLLYVIRNSCQNKWNFLETDNRRHSPRPRGTQRFDLSDLSKDDVVIKRSAEQQKQVDNNTMEMKKLKSRNDMLKPWILCFFITGIALEVAGIVLDFQKK